MKSAEDFNSYQPAWHDYLRAHYLPQIAAAIISNPEMLAKLNDSYQHDGSGENKAIAGKAMEITNALIEKL